MDFVEILKYIGMALTLMDMFAGMVPDKWLSYHSFILRAGKSLHEFGIDETKAKGKK